MKFSLPFYYFVSCTFDVIFKRIFTVVFFLNLTVITFTFVSCILAFTFRSYIKILSPSWVDFCMHFDTRVQCHIFTCEYPAIPLPFVLKTIFHQSNCFLNLWKISWAYLCGSIPGLYSVSLIYECIPLSVPHSLGYCSYAINIEIR